jgi:hypothetical protein
MPIYYVLAAVFASCFYVLKSLLHECGHIFYYVLAAVFASCFYVLFEFRFVNEAPKGGYVCMYTHTHTHNIVYVHTYV